MKLNEIKYVCLKLNLCKLTLIVDICKIFNEIDLLGGYKIIGQNIRVVY